MKKLFVICLTVLFALFSFSSVSASDKISVKVNGQKLSFDQPPAMVDNRVLVPLRGIFEALGAKVEWDSKTQVIDAYKDGEIIFRIAIGWNGAYIGPNQQEIRLDVPPQIINGRTMVPGRFVAETLGAEVNWDGVSKTVSISTEKANQFVGSWVGKDAYGDSYGYRFYNNGQVAIVYIDYGIYIKTTYSVKDGYLYIDSREYDESIVYDYEFIKENGQTFVTLEDFTLYNDKIITPVPNSEMDNILKSFKYVE